MTQDFNTALAAFVQGVQHAYDQKPGIYSEKPARIETDVGPRYVRIVCVETSDWDGQDHRRVHCFVDRTSGEILKGGWKQPRKNKIKSFGNIFDSAEQR